MHHPARFYFLLVLCITIFTGTELLAQKWDTLATIPERFTFPVVDVLEGKIHIVGGGGVGGATDHHYAYDPATDTWESLAAVPYRAQQPAGAAANGKMHFFGGGFPNTGTPLDDHYVYDPNSDSWEMAADLTAPRAIHYAVTLDTVLYSLAGQGMATLCQTYDPDADAWITKNNFPDNGFWYGAHVAVNGHIYRFCGGGYTAPNNKAHRYDPDTDTWHALPAFPAATHGLRGAAIGDKIYLAGGYHDFLERDEVWIFNTQTEEYTQGISLPLGRNYHNMVALDSCIYILGGNHAIDETVSTQLIRLCPYEISSGTKELVDSRTLTGRYKEGSLVLDLPEIITGSSDLSLFDVTGALVFLEHLTSGDSGHYETWVGDLAPMMYVLQLRTEDKLYVGKIIVPR